MTIWFLIALAILAAVGFATGSTQVTSAAASGGGATPASQPSSGIYYASDSSLTGAPITNDPNSWPGSDKVYNICAAVAIAEGYNQGVGTAPYDLNNPGDLSPGDEGGQATCAVAQQHGGSSIIVFCTAEAGWQALHLKFSDIVNGASSVYPASWTWQQVAQKYAGSWQNWLTNVTNYLGVDPTSTPADYVNS